jgi:Na+/H+ antiporter
MDEFKTILIVVLGLLAAVVGLSALSQRTRIPSPTLMVLAGLAIALLPGQMQIPLKPELVLMIFMPPILYGAAWDTTWHDFWRNIRPISLLAVGLVFVTMAAVAGVAKLLIPEMPWAVAFVLGAIVSPPDAAAATAVCSKLRVPKRIITILEGESLVNDASGLIAYKFAVAAALTGVFSWADAGIQLVQSGIGGIAYGVLVGWSMAHIHRLIKDANVATALSLLAPYVAYIPAEEFMHVSGVLAAVAAGIIVSWRSPDVFSAAGRLQARPVWEVLILLINGFLFIMIGVQIDPILRGTSNYSPLELVTYCAAISATAIAVRIIWVFPAAWIPRLFTNVRRRDPIPRSSALVVIGWSGMRGSVSLAAALAVPNFMKDDVTPFPYRDLVVAMVFAVILVTLVLQGLTLAPLIRKLGIEVNEDAECATEVEARYAAVMAGYEHLERLGTPGSEDPEVVARVREQYEKRMNQLKVASLLDRVATAAMESEQGVAARLELLAVERKAIVRMRERGEINDELFRKLEKELDLDEIRLGQLLS